MSGRGGCWWLPLGLLLFARAASAATAYVSDDLILGVYAEPNGQGAKLATLHSGASVETLSTGGSASDFTQVRLADGSVGWVKSSYLTTRVPAAARVKQLEEELDRSRATTPALAAAAARSELDALKRELAGKDADLAAARAALPGASASTTPAALPAARGRSVLAWWGGLFASAGLGFALGYATLARRIRQKFGGLKVY